MMENGLLETTKKIVIKHCGIFFSSQKAGLVQININVIWLGKLTIMHFRYKCEVLEELR